VSASGRGGWRHAAALATAAAGFALGALSLTWRIDQSLYDGTLSLWSRPVADDIVIVAIDDASLAAIGRWPWPRAVHATLLDRLAQGQPRAIALDLLLSEPDPDPHADALLAAAMQRAAPVVLPSYFFAAPTRGLQPLAPAAPLAAAAARIAHMDAETDTDGMLRHAWLRAGLRRTPDDAADPPLLPHLALALLEAAGERVHPSLDALRAPSAATSAQPAWRRDERVLIRYAGAPGTVATVPYASVLRGDVPARAFAGKLVLVGATAPGLGDAFPTPVSGGKGPMAGVEVSAQLADALRGGHGLRALPPWGLGLLAALLALLLFAAYARHTAGRALQITAGAVLLALVASAALVGAGVWLPPVALVLTAMLAYPLWSWQRLAAAQRFVDAELARWPDPSPADTARAGDPLDQRLAALRRAGDAVRQARRFVTDSLAALPEAVFVTDAAGTVLIANAQAARLLGGDAADPAIGRPLAAVLAAVTPLESTGWPALIEAAQRSDAPLVTRARAGAAEQAVDLLARLAPFGTPAGEGAAAHALVVSLADVTRLTAAERSRDELLAFVTHDLRSPQATLVSMAELARFGRLTLAPDQLLEQVELLARRTLSMADEFLQLGGADARALQFAPLDLAAPVREAVDEVGPQAQVRGVRLAARWPAAPVPVRGDATLLRRACVNLLTNALKFSPSPGVVEIDVEQQDDAAVLRVRDHGPGIPAEIRDRLFRRYERAADADHRPALLQGVGLGLVLGDSVARRHGGAVSVESEPGQGACFTLRLPLAARQTPPAP
jgi:CHASE2 domain-containing sensor protein/signal transduction histidine kinase